MKNIHTIYYNNFGIAFQWKKDRKNPYENIQLVFRETGVSFDKEELCIFKKQIKSALKESQKCQGCTQVGKCRSLLLETPLSKLSFAVSLEDLYQLQDLVSGTLFTLDYTALINLNNICSN